MQTEQADTAAAPKAHPYAFKDMWDAREALREHVHKVGDAELAEVRKLTSALRGWSYMTLTGDDLTPVEEDKHRCGDLLI